MLVVHFGRKDILVHSESFLLRPPPLGEARKENSLPDLTLSESVRPRKGSFFESVWRLIPGHLGMNLKLFCIADVCWPCDSMCFVHVTISDKKHKKIIEISIKK